MTGASILLREEIQRRGPISFSRFMDVALYHPEFGYYRRTRDPFGREGDFYTAEQMQPVFGRLIAAAIRDLHPPGHTIVELGAGRAEMAEAFTGRDYIPLDLGAELPDSFSGVVFSNEFFDALPVDVIAPAGEMRVAHDGSRFHWMYVGGAAPSHDCGLRPADDSIIEVRPRAVEWLQMIDQRMREGFVVTIDYGYQSREAVRFPEGTLMSYRRHHSMEDVLTDPGERDITAHVCFSCLIAIGERLGWTTVRFESLTQMLLRAGEADNFTAALEARDQSEAMRFRLQLKSLLFGMGETFQVLVQKKSIRQ